MKMNFYRAKKILKESGYIVEAASSENLVEAASALKNKLNGLFSSFKSIKGKLDYCYDVPIRIVGTHPKVRASFILSDVKEYDDTLEKYISKTIRYTWEIEFINSKTNEVNANDRVRVLFGNDGSTTCFNFNDAVDTILKKIAYIDKRTTEKNEWDNKYGSGLGASQIKKSWYSGS